MSHHEQSSSMQKENKYCYETFEASRSDFDSQFSEFLNTRYNNGWEYENCQFTCEGDRQIAHCIFERD